ncbi:hypothetical protein AWRI1631_61010 [Saccharomyces cerevisiae AWRI1631]|uniref:Uncharacterized protein n=1 Tax=Saccharomyces cerevisiae (strain AWRI1631) TaxID=545124 RepID=B5VI61_YEAS6|nr:hypothetical protein AWRI1631_61010 [Saccharomyces cerevisiae AWRI1631]
MESPAPTSSPSLPTRFTPCPVAVLPSSSSPSWSFSTSCMPESTCSEISTSFFDTFNSSSDLFRSRICLLSDNRSFSIFSDSFTYFSFSISSCVSRSHSFVNLLSNFSMVSLTNSWIIAWLSSMYFSEISLDLSETLPNLSSPCSSVWTASFTHSINFEPDTLPSRLSPPLPFSVEPTTSWM